MHKLKNTIKETKKQSHKKEIKEIIKGKGHTINTIGKRIKKGHN